MGVHVTGELKRRLEANAKRLQDAQYAYPQVFWREGYSWPGDWEGRTMLALCCIVKADIGTYSRSALAQVRTIVEHLDEFTNTDGYFGDLFDGKIVNEQQLSGNSWFLRGLCEYFSLTQDEAILSRIRRICDAYLCKLGEFFNEYPLCEREVGGVGGHLETNAKGNWLLSSDVGCAFILLDGITAAYELYPSEQLRGVIERMLGKYLSLDFVKVHCQTHATLSGLRGLLRFGDLVGDPALYAHAERICDLYCKCGMTVNYANCNWFGKPYWTEPCAIVDSLIVAQKLFLHTKRYQYLQLVNRIYRNALRSGQRENGGAGCDTCVTSDNGSMKVYMYEAFFCCTMRLAEGLLSLAAFAAVSDEKTIWLTLMEPCSLRERDIEVDFKVEKNAESGTLEVIVHKNTGRRSVRVYFPKNASIECSLGKADPDGCFVLPEGEGMYLLRCRCLRHTENISGQTVQFLGDDLLSKKNEERDFTPIQDASALSKDELLRLVQHFW